MIYPRWSTEWRKVRRRIARGGVFFGRALDSFAASGSIAVTPVPMVILGVFHDQTSTSRRPLRRTVRPDGALYTGTYPIYWDVVISEDGNCTVSILPAPTTGTIKVSYIPEPAAVTSGSTDLYMPDTWKDAVVLGAALRCYARAEGSNGLISGLYREALEDLDADTAQMTDTVIRNVDDVYPPGDENTGMAMVYDPADFWWSP